MKRRLAYTLLGSGVGVIVALLIGAALGKGFQWGPTISIAIGFGSIAVAIAERRKKVETMEEINRPLTLFPPASGEKK